MIDFDKRLKALKDRRQGSRERALYESFDFSQANDAIARGIDIRGRESYEKLDEAVGVKYAIGAMAAVDDKATQVSKDEGDRVASNLIKSLDQCEEYTVSRLQGSVALDVHIKGHSDVDMLIICKNTVNIETPVVMPSQYLPSTDHRSSVDIAKGIRTKSEIILPTRYPRADVDCSGNKSIALSGGSLRRKVDIVPAIWYDSIKYQTSKNEPDRGVQIYNKKDHKLLLNYPFLHILLVNHKDRVYDGNLKCVTRMMKNVIADMPENKRRTAKKLSSFDLTAIAYNMNDNLAMASYFRLGLVEKTRAYLSLLLSVETVRQNIWVPDGTRKVFDSPEKIEALSVLKNEFTELAQAIYRELRPYSTTYDANGILLKMVA